MDSFEQIAHQAQKLAKQHTTTDLGAFALNIIAFPLLMGGIALPTDDTSETMKVAVPGDWLASVAALPTISRPGLELLADALKAKGWVSVAEAVQFIRLEQRAMADAAQVTPSNEPSQGASLLLARAEQELPGTIQRFAEGAQSFVEAAGGILSFTAETALYAGKSLGSAAQVIRNFRKD